MKILYDNETDSIYVKFSKMAIESEEVKKDEIVSAEVLNVKSNPHEINIPTVLKSA